MAEEDNDHSPGLVIIQKEQHGRKPFRFFKMWVETPKFIKTLLERLGRLILRGV